MPLLSLKLTCQVYKTKRALLWKCQLATIFVVNRQINLQMLCLYDSLNWEEFIQRLNTSPLKLITFRTNLSISVSFCLSLSYSLFHLQGRILCGIKDDKVIISYTHFPTWFMNLSRSDSTLQYIYSLCVIDFQLSPRGLISLFPQYRREVRKVITCMYALLPIQSWIIVPFQSVTLDDTSTNELGSHQSTLRIIQKRQCTSAYNNCISCTVLLREYLMSSRCIAHFSFSLQSWAFDFCFESMSIFTFELIFREEAFFSVLVTWHNSAVEPLFFSACLSVTSKAVLTAGYGVLFRVLNSCYYSWESCIVESAEKLSS